jgi:hypothetical protein
MPREITPRRLLVFAVVAFSLPGAAAAQTPSPNEVARCRSIVDRTAQFACFRALNEKMKRAAKQNPAPETTPSPASPAPPAALPAPPPPPPIPAAAEVIPPCANLANPQKRLSCYDSKWLPPPAAPTPPLPFNN